MMNRRKSDLLGGSLVLNLWLKFVCNVCMQVDYEMALEYATQSGVNEEPRETIYIQSLEYENKMIDLHSPFIVFRVFE